MDLKGRLSNPPQRRLWPADIDDLIAACQTGGSINKLAVEFGIHRTTVTGHLDRHGVPRHREQTAWDDEILNACAQLMLLLDAQPEFERRQLTGKLVVFEKMTKEHFP